MDRPKILNSLKIERSIEADGRVVLALDGALDVDGVPLLSEELRRLLDTGTRAVDLEFSHVSFLSSLGIGCLIAAIGDFEHAGAKLVVAGLTEETRQVFAMLDLLDYIPTR